MLEHERFSGIHTPLQQNEFVEAKNRWYLDILDGKVDPSGHPDFHKIVGMGESAVPLILNELEVNPSLLFVALEMITGENPVPEKGYDSLEDINEYWQDWGRVRKSNITKEENTELS